MSWMFYCASEFVFKNILIILFKMANELLSTIKIHIVSLDENIVSIFNSIFTQTDSKYKNISVEYRNIAQCESFDCIVSPANS